MRTIHLIAAFFLVCLLTFLFIDGSREIEILVLVVLITLFASLLIYLDFRETRPKSKIWQAIAILWAISATLGALPFFAGFGGSGVLLVPVFMLIGGLLYHGLDSSSTPGSAPRT
jgi:Trk-type K+ transport system membrane component